MRRILWEWNVRALAFDDQVVAAAAGRFDCLTLPYRKYLAETAAGRAAEDLAATAVSAGIALDYLDGMSGWCRVRYPDGADEFLRTAMDFGPEEAFALCERTSMKRIVAIAGFAAGQIETAELVDSFGAFCDAAAQHGIWVDLEPMPMLGLPTLGHAWDVVRQAARPNSAVLLDTWHFMRGGAPFDLLESLPRGAIGNVQIVDGLAEQFGPDLWEDAMHHREFPGLGALPLDRILRILAATQDITAIGPEALSDRVDRLPAKELGPQARDTLDRVAGAAGLI